MNIFLKGILFIAMFSFLTTISTHAQVSANHSNADGSVTYLGTQGGQISYNLKFDNNNNERFLVTITDADGNMLFEGIYADRKFSKTFLVNAEINTLTFTISNPRNHFDKKFEINAERRLVEKVYVTQRK